MKSLAGALVLVAAMGAARFSAAQSSPPEDEESFFRDRFLYSGEVALNAAPKDRGYFNQTEYTHDSLRLFRVSFALEFRAADSLSVLTEIRSDNLDAPRPYALYLRYRPWEERGFDLQVGRIPPVFGKFARRRYEADNPLIGYPVPYQYASTLRANAAPASLEQLLAYRGYGAVVRYPVGDPSVREGLAQVNPLRWDTGVQAKIGSEGLELAVALTQGTLSNPLVRDDNDGKQIAGRFAVRPAFGVELGVSASSGDYVSDEVKSELSYGGARAIASTQTAIGIDGDFVRGPVILRGEAIWTRWDVPTLPTGPLPALGYLVELRYKMSPGFFSAFRISGSRFGTIDAGERRVSWDASVTRLEAGVGYSFHRQLLGKLALQYNERDGGRIRTRLVPAVQLLFWF